MFTLFLATPIFGQTFYKVNPTVVHQRINQLEDNPQKLDTIAKYVRQLFMNAEIDSSQKYANQGLALAKQLNRDDKIAFFNLSKSRVQSSMGQNQTAIKYLLEAKKHSIKADSTYLSSILFALTKTYGKMNQGDSLAHYYEQTKAFNDRRNPYDNWGLDNLMFEQNRGMGNSEQAWHYLNSAYEMTQEKGDRMDYGYVLQLKKGFSQETQNWEALANVLADEEEFNKKGKKKLNNIHQVFDNDEGLSVAQRKDKYKRLISSFERLKFITGQAAIKTKLAKLWIEEKQYAKAIPLLQASAKLYEQEQGLESLLESNYQLLIQALKKENRLAEALTVSEKLLALKDDLKILNKNKVLLELESKYASQKKSDSLAILNVENNLKDTRLKSSTQQKYFLLIGLLGLSLFSFFLYTLFLKNKQKNISLKEKNLEIAENLKDKEYLIQEVHHRVKNNLQLVSSLLSMQSRSLDDHKAREALKDGQNRVQSMALIHQNLYKEDDLEGVNFKNYINLICQNLIGSFEVKEDTIILEINVEEMILDVNTAISLGIIINELVTNSFKYAFPENRPGTVSISARRKEDYLELVVKDNGIGMDADAEAGFGNRLIRIFAKKLEANWEVTQSNGTINVFQVTRFNILR